MTNNIQQGKLPDGNKVKEMTSKFGSGDVRQLATDVGEKVQGFLSDQKEKLEEGKEKCEKMVKSNPFVALAVVFAGGVLLSRLFGRK